MAITLKGVGTGVGVATANPVIPLPTAGAAPAAGDFITIVFARRGSTAAPTAPAGYSTVVVDNNSHGAGYGGFYYKVAVGGDADPTITAAGTDGKAGRSAVWSGVDTTTPIDVAGTFDNDAGALGTVINSGAGITTLTNGAMVLFAGTMYDDLSAGAAVATGGVPTWAEAFEFSSVAGLDESLVLDYGEMTTAGAVGTPSITMTPTGGGSQHGGVLIALKPSAGGTDVTVSPSAAAATAASAAPTLEVAIAETAGAATASAPDPTVSAGGSPVSVSSPAASATASAVGPALQVASATTAGESTASATGPVATLQMVPGAAASTASAVGPALTSSIAHTAGAATAGAVEPVLLAAITSGAAAATAASVAPGLVVQVLAPAAQAFAYAAPPTNFASAVLPVTVGDGAPVIQPDVPTHGRR